MTAPRVPALSGPAEYWCPVGDHPWVGVACGWPDGTALACALHAADPPRPPAPAGVVTAMAFVGEGATTEIAAAHATRAARTWLQRHGITPEQIVGPPVATLAVRGRWAVTVRYVLAYTFCVPAGLAAQIAAETEAPDER
jgi:hypothetical protein